MECRFLIKGLFNNYKIQFPLRARKAWMFIFIALRFFT